MAAQLASQMDGDLIAQAGREIWERRIDDRRRRADGSQVRRRVAAIDRLINDLEERHLTGERTFDCWLLLRGLKTLALRVQRQSDSALAIARHLEGHPAVRAVFHPGLASHPQHELAQRQMNGIFGGMVSFELED